ncbi:transposase [Streptomyces sp. NPDC059906]|uniref:transposase n=1 Tax=Streptomyces sp. NPDC059906 TaxID=3346997 RepID=UPI00364B88C3
MLGFAHQHAPGRRCWALEGTGSYGAGLAASLDAAGENVVEVCRPKRPAIRGGRKTDIATELELELLALVCAVAPELLALQGIGPISAARILISWLHSGCFRSEAAFAAFAGVAPIPASSGLTNRHRINRSGDRQLNRALHTITLIRICLDPITRAYVARRISEGKTARDAQRCLKRAICRQLFKLLERGAQPTRQINADDLLTRLIEA